MLASRHERAADLFDRACALGAGAAPELARLPVALRRRALAPLDARLAGGEPWSSFNLSRHRARMLLEEHGLGAR